MKSTINFTLSLAMVLFMAVSCVSPPPPADTEPQAGIQAETAAQPIDSSAAAAPAGAPAETPLEAPAETPAMPAAGPEVIAGAQAAPLAAAKPAPVSGGSSPGSSSVPTSPAPTVTEVNPGTQPGTPSISPPPAPVKPAAPAIPPAPAGLASPPAPAATASPEKPRQVGEVVYTEGTVSVHRAGKSVMPLDIGDVVYAYDVVMTGPSSLAQVDLGAGRPGGAFLRLSGNTAFYFDTRELSAEQRKTVLQLLSGSIAVKVERLAGGSFSVASDTAVLGVRGTEFVIDTIPDGSLLVSCIEGAVTVQGPEGQTATAQPGRTVAGRDTGLATTTVGLPDLARFRSTWRQESLSGFAGQAVQYSSGYAATLDSRRSAFEAALADLRSQEATLSLWREARASGRVPRFAEWTAEKKAVGSALLESLKALFIIERPYYRLLELKSLHAGGIGAGTLQDGRSTAVFFNQFDSRYGSLADGMASVREALLLFAWASAGSPLGEFFGVKAEGLGSGALLLDGDDW